MKQQKKNVPGLGNERFKYAYMYYGEIHYSPKKTTSVR